MNPWLYLLLTWAGSAILMALLWFYCQTKRNAGYVDAAWAFTIGLSALIGACLVEGTAPRRVGVALLAIVWAWRLSLHLWRRIHGQEEDGRYQAMRSHFAPRAGLAFFVFFQMQALFVVLFVGPIIAAMSRPGPIDWRDLLGLMIWSVAILGESIADRQLAAFKRDPDSEGQVCRRGLWRYSRHPNYFFEWLHWFAYLAIGASLVRSIGWLALAGPAVMLLFLILVTGIPYTEQRARQSKGEAYRQYQRDTSPFIPWFPKHREAP
ncbi:MAG: DUF1295 domain-containing protein [Phycisphaerales bacterium JB063]